MAKMTSHGAIERRITSLLLLSALFSLSSLNTRQTALAFSNGSKPGLRPTLSPSATSLSTSSSIILRSEGDKSPQKTVPHRRKDLGKHIDNPNNDVLQELGLPSGLRKMLLDNVQEECSKRICILDNSGSMKTMDGHYFSESIGTENDTNDEVYVPRLSMTNSRGDGKVSRWTELRDVFTPLSVLEDRLKIPTDYRLLNPPPRFGRQNFSVGYPKFLPFRSDSSRAEKIMNQHRPKGRTPLCTAIEQAKEEVVGMLHRLRADGTSVTIRIITDGFVTDEDSIDLEKSFESLKGLPVNVVVRLCTDNGPTIDFFDDLDQRMEEVDVLDDYEAEAAQVSKHNPWLNYALLLHRMRELGLQSSSHLLDLLDERPFRLDEIQEFVALLFGTSADLLPDPLYDSENFLKEIEYFQKQEIDQWNPRKRKMTPWIDTEELMAILGPVTE